MSISPWANPAEIEWADAHGVDLAWELRLELIDGARVHGQNVKALRAKYDERIERQLAGATGNLGDLYRRGLAETGRVKAMKAAHRLRIETIPADYPRSYRAVCSCGEWTGPAVSTKKRAEEHARDERGVIGHWAYHRPEKMASARDRNA